MKILYESTVLGMGHNIERAKTGIFRVIENILIELLNRDDLTVNLTSVQSKKAQEDLSKYVKELGSELKINENAVFQANNLMFQERRENALHSLLSPPFLKPDKVKNFYRILDASAQLSISTKTKSLEKDGFDIFHSPYHPIPTGLKNNKSIKKFWTSYDLIPILFPHFFLQETIDEVKCALSRLDRDTWVVCISESTKNDLLNYLGNKIDPAKLVVTPLAASNNFYKVEDANEIKNVLTKYSIPTDKPYILSLCTLEPRKNIVQIIKAFVNLVQDEKINDLHLVLAGTKGWKFDAIFNEVKHVDVLRNKVFATGYVSKKDQAALYSGAKMFAYPSFYEGFGLPPLEAMQCGVPVITSNTSSLPEVVGNAGIMVDPYDLASLTQSMLNLYRNESLQKEYGIKALERSKIFTWHQTANLTVAAYKKSIFE
jgi:glycosyltransferase involved in cell wall biosynthesis